MASALAEAYVTVSMDGGKVPGQLSNLKSMVAGAVGDMASTFAMTGFVFHRLVDTAKDFAMAISEDEEEVIRFNNAVEASGRGQAFVQMTEQIGRASAATTAFSEDAVRAAATAIAPFKTLSNEMAGRVLKVAEDLAAQFGGNLTDKARTLARSLERPEIGMRQLRSAGVNLTAQQQEQIMTMLKLGQVAEAQEALLTIAAEKGAGAAVKMGGTLKGIWTRIKTELGELSEAMGGKMMSSLKAFGETAIAVLKGFRDLIEGDTLVSKIAQVAAGFMAFALAGSVFERVFSTVKGLLWGTLGPLGWIIAGVSAITFQFVSLSDILAWFRSVWDKTVAAVVNSGLLDRLVISVKMLGEAFLNVFSLLGGTSVNWKGMFEGLGDWIAWAITKLTEFALEVVDFFTGVVQNAETYWEKVKIVTETAWITMIGYMENTFLPAAAGVWAAFVASAKLAFEYLEAIVENQLDRMTVRTTNALNWVLEGIAAPWIDTSQKALPPPLATMPIEKTLANITKATQDAFTEAQSKSKAAGAEGNIQRQKDQDALNKRQAEIDKIHDDAKNFRALQRWDRENQDRIKAEEDYADAWWAETQAMMDDSFKPDKGGKKVKEEKGMATGFVGVAEFAKQFQASILKTDADRYAKQTADNTDVMKESMQQIEENTEDMGVFQK